MKTYIVRAKLYHNHSILTFDNKEVAYRWLMHDDGSTPIQCYGVPVVIRSYIYGEHGLQSFIDEYFNPEVVKLEIL